MMRISQLAERSGVPATTLRFYETSGLLPADRSEAGYRLYGEDAVRRLAFIGAGKHLGLPLAEIAELVAVWESGACADVKADLRPRIADHLAAAEQRSAELRAFISTLGSALEHLDALPDHAEPCGPQCAAILTAAPRRTVPVACSLTGDGMRERIAQWQDVLDGAAHVEIPGGVRLTVAVERAAAVADLAVAEQRCCPFFDFRLHLDGPNLHLEVRAPEAGGELLGDLLAPVLSRLYVLDRASPPSRKVRTPRGAGYGFQSAAVDGLRRFAARRPTTTRPPIGKCESVAV